MRPVGCAVAAVSHCGTPTQARGDSAAVIRASARRLSGIEGARPSSAPLFPQRVGWLPASNRVGSQPCGRLRTAPAHRPKRRTPGRRGEAPRPLGRQPHERRGATGRPVTLRRRRRSQPCSRFPPYPYPSGTGDRRSWAIPRPVAYPKYPWDTQKRPSEPVAEVATRQVRSPCLLSGPRDTPTSRPSGHAAARTGPSAGHRSGGDSQRSVPG